jgi:hypothetical protein
MVAVPLAFVVNVRPESVAVLVHAGVWVPLVQLVLARVGVGEPVVVTVNVLAVPWGNDLELALVIVKEMGVKVTEPLAPALLPATALETVTETPVTVVPFFAV